MSTHILEKSSKIQNTSGSGIWVAAFFLVGVLIGLLGPLPVVWQYHVNTNPQAIGLHFLCFNIGYLIAGALAQSWLLRFRIRSMALFACTLAFLGLIALTFLIPPVEPAWRLTGLAVIGFAAGLLTATLLFALEPFFTLSVAHTANRAGLFFGLGCLSSAVVTGSSYFAGSVRWETALLSAAPLVFLLLFARTKYPAALKSVPHRMNRSDETRRSNDTRTVAAFLFSVLLFVQFGNEWAIAGWLPIFLIHRLGSNPVWAIFALGAYFLALMTGRALSQRLLPRLSHRKLLIASVFLAMSGYLLLSFTGSMLGAWIAVMIIGSAFAPIFPLIAETLDDRFSYQPGFYNGIFSVAITGAMCAPWLLSYLDAYLGIQYVMLVPALGSVVVFVLALLLMFEAHLMRPGPDPPSPKALSAAAGKE